MKKIDWHYWNQFLSDIESATAELGNPNVIWYRGVTSEHHTLVPSLVRLTSDLNKERALFERFEQISRGFRVASASRVDWDGLYEMQHYGVPTRLLDWTEVLGIAVFFALLKGAQQPSYIYLLNPVALNAKVGKQDLIGEWDRESFSYRQVFWDGKPFVPSLPLALNPTHSNSRLAAQRGRFTVHGVESRSIDETAPDCVRRVKLPLEAKAAAQEFLSIAGLNEFSVFPDVAGAAPFLKSIVGL